MDTILDRNNTLMLHLLTEHEASILDAAHHVKFGELVNVEIQHDTPRVSRKITAAQIAFILTLREEGLTYMDTIIVHNGAPSQIEIDGQYKTIKYKRKIRFN